MTIAARPVATVAAPLDAASADAPRVLHRPGHRILVQRGDREARAAGGGAWYTISEDGASVHLWEPADGD